MGDGIISIRGPLQPVKWGQDNLSGFLEASHRNRIATFANKAEQFQRLEAIDRCFVDVSTGWLNPGLAVERLLFLRTLGAFRGAVAAAMAGACADAYVMIRSCLEAAGYVAHISTASDLAEIWLRRHDDDDAKKIAKRRFQVSEVRASIAAKDVHTAERFDRLYNEAIDFGAHPNERTLTGNMTMEHVAEGIRLEHVLLQGDGVPLDHALRSAAQAGLCSVDILRIPFGARFSLLGVEARALELRKGL